MVGRVGFLLQTVVSALIALTLPTVARAVDAIPNIVAHSEVQFAVNRGDQLTVEALADDEKAEVKWITNNEIICRTRVCEIDTNRWSAGYYRVTLVVFNDRGSASLAFRINVNNAPIGYKPTKVTPKLVSPSADIQTVDTNDHTVRMLAGRGFSYDAKKLQVIGNLPRAITWQEKLRSQPGSLMVISRSAAESHTLGYASTANLVKAKSGHRAIVLNSGVLRSRQLDGQRPRWSILVGNWLQIDGDELADILVTKPKADVETVQVVVLRGTARIFKKKTSESARDNDTEGETSAESQQNIEPTNQAQAENSSAPESNSEANAAAESENQTEADQLDRGTDDRADFVGVTRYLPQGLAMTFKQHESTPVEASIPKASKVGKQVKRTTPFYQRDQRADAARQQETLLRGQVPSEFKEALLLAEEAYAISDVIKVIEILAGFLDETKKSFKGAMLLGHAYRGIYLYKDAFFFYRNAQKLRPRSPEPAFAIGTMYLADRNWKKAEKYLQHAVDLDHDQEQLLQYYLGVAKYRQGKRLAADSHFQYAIWAKGNSEIEASAREFRGTIVSSDWIDLRLAADIFLDSNVMRAGAASSEMLQKQNISASKKISTLGYTGSAGFSLWALRTREAQLGLVFDIAKRSYNNADLKNLELIDQSVGLDMGVGFWKNADDQPRINLLSTIKAQMIFVGEERAMDRLRSNVSIEAPLLYRLAVGFRSDLNLDPLPARDDIYDPVIQEVVPASERSHRQFFYLVSAKPMMTSQYELDVKLTTGDAKYRNDLRSDEDFSEHEIILDFAFQPSARQRFNLEGQTRRREYVKSDDKRQDQSFTIGLGWLMRYTTALSGRMFVMQEQQQSNRDSNAYARQLCSYGLRLDL